MSAETLDPEVIAEAARLLNAGAVVALPTETVYGVCARPDDDDAVAALFALKKRAASAPIAVLAPDLDAALAAFADGDAKDRARALGAAFWPGPLTVIAPPAPCRTVDRLRAGAANLGVRVPDHALCQAVIRAAGGLLAASSANESGAPASASADEVRAALGDGVALVVDGGRSRIGVASTVVDVSAPALKVFREGSVTRADLERALRTP